MTTLYDDPRDWSELSVMADYSASGVWVRGACITDLSVLGLSSGLIADFAAWIDRYDPLCNVTPFDFDAFDRTGRELATRLKRELPNTRISYFPETTDPEADEGSPTWEEIQ